MNLSSYLNKKVKIMTVDGEILKGKLQRIWVNYTPTLGDCYLYHINRDRILANSVLSIEEVK